MFAGEIFNGRTSARTIQSTMDGEFEDLLPGQKSINLYENLECPTEEKYLELVKELKFDPQYIKYTCDDTMEGKFARLIYLLDTLKPKVPKTWPVEIQQNLKDAIKFISSKTNLISYDLKQQDSIAYNKSNEKDGKLREVYMGQLFFKDTPLEALTVLIHEARHSYPDAPTHYPCQVGDLPSVSGGCDAYFNLEEKDLGAYGYHSLYAIVISLYEEKLSKADKEFLMSSGLWTIAHRFNAIHKSLALSYDLVAALDEEGGLYLIHPFTLEKIPQKLVWPKDAPKEKIVKIGFHNRYSGLLLFTESKNIFQWQPGKPVERFYSEQTLGKNFVESNRVMIPFNQASKYVVLNDKNEMFYIDYSPEDSSYVLNEYNTKPIADRSDYTPQIERYVLALLNQTAFVSKDHKIFLGRHYGNHDVFRSFENVYRASEFWIDAVGGVLNETLILVSDKGELFQMKPQYDFSGDAGELVPEELSPVKMDDDWGVAIQKIRQGLQIEAVLDQNNQISVKGSPAAPPVRVEGNFKDVAVIRVWEAMNPIVPEAKVEQARFKTNCGLQKVIADPWLNLGIGVASNGQIIFKGAKGKCVNSDKISVDLNRISLSPYSEGNPFFRPALNLSDFEVWFPYTK